MNLDGGDFRAEWAKSYNHCSNICSLDSYCKMWTYYLKDNLKKCYLKQTSSAGIQLARCENCISGVRDSKDLTCDKKCKI